MAEARPRELMSLKLRRARDFRATPGDRDNYDVVSG
jgi:hypothetical protein